MAAPGLPEPFRETLEALVGRYLAEIAAPDEHLSLLRWQIGQGHRLEARTTLPGHVTTSAFIVSPDERQILLIDHVAIGRWLQPGGHYEPAESFAASAAREAVEETAIDGLRLHPWHRGGDLPFAIDSHDVPGKPARHEVAHVHHDLQYLFIADPAAALKPQAEEVHAARWYPVAALVDIAPRALRRLQALAGRDGRV
jgi:8-oxo-dGTP pyrophosphatase MutT (NUDIX family)